MDFDVRRHHPVLCRAHAGGCRGQGQEPPGEQAADRRTQGGQGEGEASSEGFEQGWDLIRETPGERWICLSALSTHRLAGAIKDMVDDTDTPSPPPDW